MATRKIQLQIAEISGGGQIPLDQIVSPPGSGVTAVAGQTGPAIFFSSPDASVGLSIPTPNHIAFTTPAVADAAAAQSTADSALAEANGATVAAANAQAEADGATVAAAAAQTSADSKLPINNPTLTGVLHAPNGGAGPTIGWAGTGGEYGFRYDDILNRLEVWRAGAIVVTIDFQAIIIDGALASLTLSNDTALEKTGGGFAKLSNPFGLQVVNGAAEWGHSIPATQPAGGPAIAGPVYTAAEQNMLQILWDALRDKGTIS